MDRSALATLYVLDLLPAPERAAVEAALPGDPELAGLVAEMRRTQSESSPLEGLDRLMAQVRADETQRDGVAAEDPGLRADLVELLALHEAMSRKLEALAEPAPAPAAPSP